MNYRIIKLYPNLTRFCFIPLLAGVLYTLGFPSILVPSEKYFFWTPMLSLSILFRVLLTVNSQFQLPKFRWAAIALFSYSLVIFAIGVYWIPVSIHVFTEIPMWKILPFGALVGLFSIPQYWLFMLSTRILNSQHRVVAFFKRLRIGTLIAVMALYLTVLEFFIVQYFPVNTGVAWAGFAPFLGLAPFIGSIGYSYFGTFMALWLALVVRTSRQLSRVGIVFLSFLLLNALVQLWNNREAGKNFIVTKLRMIQANVDRYLKCEAEGGNMGALGEIYQTLESLNLKPVEGRKLDMIIWPETSYPLPFESKTLKKHKNMLPELLTKLTDQMQTEFLIGGYDSVETDTTRERQLRYNTAFHFSSEGSLKDVYYKNRLMPIGEEIPFYSAIGFMKDYIRNYSEFDAGEGTPLFKMANGVSFLTLICFEAVISRLIAKHMNSAGTPNIVFNISNDSWFGGTIMPVQNLFYTRWVALEFGVPVVRVASTGVSAVITPNGLVTDEFPYGVAMHKDVEVFVDKNHRPTFYQKWGIAGALILFIFSLIFSTSMEELKTLIMKRRILRQDKPSPL